MLTRCHWVTSDPEYIQYHDEEWGIPLYDSQKLFAMLNLEGQQAGLSWITVLKKRANYYKCFFNFEPKKIIQLTEKNVEILMQNMGIIRNRLKINAIITNAKAYIDYQKNGADFSQFLWSFVDGKPMRVIGKPKLQKLALERSENMSRALKKLGFKFIGGTICYAFMQAVGMVNEHDQNCFKFERF